MLGMASMKFGCWEYSSFWLWEMPPLWNPLLSFFAPITCYFIPSLKMPPMLFLQIRLQSLSLASSSSSTLL